SAAATTSATFAPTPSGRSKKSFCRRFARGGSSHEFRRDGLLASLARDRRGRRRGGRAVLAQVETAADLDSLAHALGAGARRKTRAHALGTHPQSRLPRHRDLDHDRACAGNPETAKNSARRTKRSWSTQDPGPRTPDLD